MRASVFSAMSAVAVILFDALFAPPSPEWPGFRGPRMDWLALAATLPDRWSVRDHVTWAVDVPGQGWSSPIVANGVVYVTSAISGKPFKKPTPGIYGNDNIEELREAGLANDDVKR